MRECGADGFILKADIPHDFFGRLWGKVWENNLLNSSDYLLVVEIIYILDGNSKSYEFELKDF